MGSIQNQRVKSRLSLWVTAASILGMVLFGVTACAPAQQAEQEAGGPANPGGPGRGAFRETPAPELPVSPAALTGPIVRRSGASLFVGAIQFNFRRSTGTPGATRSPQQGTPAPYTGPVTEVVTSENTVFYKDVTQINFQPNATDQNQSQGIQQKVQTVKSLDDLLGPDATNGVVTVWGDQKGEQLVAAVVLYRARQGPRATPTGQ